jgi:hypothetical protein
MVMTAGAVRVTVPFALARGKGEGTWTCGHDAGPGRRCSGAARFPWSRCCSKHGPEMAVCQAKEIVITPGQYGCAARDLNPEPAD